MQLPRALYPHYAAASYCDAALLGNTVASITIQQLGTTGTASPEQVLARFMQFESFKKIN